MKKNSVKEEATLGQRKECFMEDADVKIFLKKEKDGEKWVNRKMTLL